MKWRYAILGGTAAAAAATTVHDLVQTKHAIIRNFPIVGHARYFLERFGPELRQYIVTSNDEERPFSRDQRSWVYASSKLENNYFGFGTDTDVETGDTLTLRVSAEELGDDDGVHEVWLINVDGKRMVAVGLLASGDAGQFEVPLGLIDKGYRIVDISVEPDDGDPTHSGVSLARGELA